VPAIDNMIVDDNLPNPEINNQQITINNQQSIKSPHVWKLFNL